MQILQEVHYEITLFIQAAMPKIPVSVKAGAYYSQSLSEGMQYIKY